MIFGSVAFFILMSKFLLNFTRAAAPAQIPVPLEKPDAKFRRIVKGLREKTWSSDWPWLLELLTPA
jgi:hypothetical protein